MSADAFNQLHVVWERPPRRATRNYSACMVYEGPLSIDLRCVSCFLTNFGFVRRLSAEMARYKETFFTCKRALSNFLTKLDRVTYMMGMLLVCLHPFCIKHRWSPQNPTPKTLALFQRRG